jgi:hypothetical protein
MLLVWTLASHAIRTHRRDHTRAWGVNPSDDGIGNTFASVGTASGAYRNHHVLFEACQQTTRDGLRRVSISAARVAGQHPWTSDAIGEPLLTERASAHRHQGMIDVRP